MALPQSVLNVQRYGGVACDCDHQQPRGGEAVQRQTSTPSVAVQRDDHGNGEAAQNSAAPFVPAPAPGVPVPSPPPPGPASSRIDVRDTHIGGAPGFIKHTMIIHHDGTTWNVLESRGGHTKGKGVCPGVGLPPAFLCPQNDPSYSAIGVGPLNELFVPGATDWPAINSRTLLQGPDADTKDACFASEAARISASCVPYSPCGPNSNSVTFTLLTNCGIEAIPPGLAWYPGWGTLL